MTLLNQIENYYDKTKDSLGWHLRHSNPITILGSIYNGFFDLERGTEMPYYFPIPTYYTKLGIKKLVTNLTFFVRYHEPEINIHGKNDITEYRRLEYFLRNFYLYQNGTMKNLMYYDQIPRTTLHRIKSFYNYTYATWFAYNIISGAALVAIVNYHLPPTILSTIPLFALVWLNYQVSDSIKNYFINNSARRLGYGHLVEGLTKHVPRNVEFTSY